MVITLISISITLSNEPIYGLKAYKFRNVRRDFSFTFKEIILIAIFSFGLCSIFTLFSFYPSMWALDAVVLYYSIRFSLQEIPVLLKNEKYIKNIIINSYRHLLSVSDKRDDELRESLNTIITNMIITEGFNNSYKILVKSGQDEKNLLDTLFDFQNQALFDCKSIINFIDKTSKDSFKELNIVKMIDSSLNTLDLCLSFSNDFNINKIYDNERQFIYQLTKTVYALKNICFSLHLNDYFETKLSSILRHSNIYINNSNKASEKDKMMFNSFLNNMVISSLNANEFWFLNMIRNNFYNSVFSPFNDDYFYYLCMMLYYYTNIMNDVPSEIKTSINRFLDESSGGINSDGSSVRAIFNNKINNVEIKNNILLLNSLLKINKTINEFFPLYIPKKSYYWGTVDGTFSKELIIDLWLEIIFSSPFDYEIDDSFEKLELLLTYDEKIRLAHELNRTSFDEKNHFSFKNITHFMSYMKVSSSKPLTDNAEIVCKLKDFKNKLIMNEIKNNYKNSSMTENVEDFKKEILSGFKFGVENNKFFDKTVILDDENDLFYSILSTEPFSIDIIKSYSKLFKSTFNNYIFEKLKNDSPIMVNRDNLGELVLKLKQMGLKYRNNKLYMLNMFDVSIENKKYIESLKIINDIFLPYFTCWGDGAIRFNAICDENTTTIRELKREEINMIIDRDFSKVNGLYRYVEYSDDARAAYISRDELYNIIEHKYRLMLVVFKMKIVCDKEKIISMKQEDKFN